MCVEDWGGISSIFTLDQLKIDLLLQKERDLTVALTEDVNPKLWETMGTQGT